MITEGKNKALLQQGQVQSSLQIIFGARGSIFVVVVIVVMCPNVVVVLGHLNVVMAVAVVMLRHFNITVMMVTVMI